MRFMCFTAAVLAFMLQDQALALSVRQENADNPTPTELATLDAEAANWDGKAMLKCAQKLIPKDPSPSMTQIDSELDAEKGTGQEFNASDFI